MRRRPLPAPRAPASWLIWRTPSHPVPFGPTQDVLAEAFLSAPLPTLPRRRRIFQREDIDVNAAKALFDQFVERYHNVATALDAGFGPKTTLSPSTWVKSVADLTTRILYGVTFSFFFPYIQCPSRGLNSVTTHVRTGKFPYREKAPSGLST